MSNFDDTNRGALFINDRKEKDTHPNMKGRINIGGKEYWLSAWTKEISQGKRQGEKMISIAVGDPVEDSVNKAKQAAQGEPSGGYSGNPQEFDDELPF